MNGWTIAAHIASWSVLGTVVLWTLYLAIMNLKSARDRGTLTPIARAIGVPILVIGYAVDFVVNVVPFSILLFEPPRETTVTARLKRHIDDDGRRGEIARWFARNFLDPFDPSGRHI